MYIFFLNPSTDAVVGPQVCVVFSVCVRLCSIWTFIANLGLMSIFRHINILELKPVREPIHPFLNLLSPQFK